MANPFAINPANPLQALMMGVQGYNQGQKYLQDAALREAGQLYAAGDLKGAQAAAARGNSLQALMGFSQLANSDRDFAFRQTESDRAQKNADRGFGLQERQIAATAGNTAASRALAERQFQWQQEQGDRPEIREETDANGNKRIVLVNRKAGTSTPINGQAAAAAERNNPFLTGGNMNEGQSNAGLFASRAMEAERILSQAGVANAGADLTERGRAKVPMFGNFLASENFQKFDQARRNFTAAILRKESGAAIGKEEYENADKQYFPQPGDSPAVIAQKKQNRIDAIRGIGAAAGAGYKPSTTIDAQGNVVDRGGAAQAGGPVRVSSPQERDALAPGTPYVAPDGSIRTKQ